MPVIVHASVLYISPTSGIVDTNTVYAQPFVATSTYTLDMIKMKFVVRYNPITSGSVSIAIYNANEDGTPTGSALATASTDPGDIPTAMNDFIEKEFTLSSPVDLIFGQNYALVVTGIKVGAGTLSIYGYNYVTSEGMWTSTDGGSSWDSQSGTLRMGHYFYGDLVPPVVVTDNAVYELYMGWAGWESIKWGVTLEQRIIYTDKRLGICYSKINEVPTYADAKDTNHAYFADGTSLVDEFVNFVTPGAKYYARAICYYLGTYNPDDYPELIGYGEVIEVDIPGPPMVENIGAINSSVFARTILTGEIVSNFGEATLVERGFEYKIQEAEPAAEDTGTEVKETKAGGFAIGEYSLKNKELYDLQYEDEENIVWWFRTYCKDGGDNKYVAETWMKNLPTVETGWDITNVVISTGVYGEMGYIRGKFSVVGNHTALYTIFSNILVAGSTGNDGFYTVNSSFYNDITEETEITVDQPVEDGTADGKVTMSNIDYNRVVGNGNIIAEGASELTMRGFEVKHEFSGRWLDSWKFENGGFEGEPEQVVVYDDFGVLILDFYWAGTLIKTVFETYALAVEAYSMTIGVMILGWPLMDDCLVEGKAYKCRAFADNEFGRAYGEEVDFSTLARTPVPGSSSPYFSEDSPTVGETTIIKNENIENLPVGITASRRGFRYGTTEYADEFDVYENGSFTNGPYSMMLVDLLPDTTYYIVAYIVVNGVMYEGDMEIITTDPEGTEDEDEYPTPHFSPHGQDYREVETKVFAEVLASQGIIDFSGGKKTLPITNHLIQTNPNAKTIADNYLNRFKLAKTRMEVTFPTPLPFEREDTVDFSFGALLFKKDDEGIINFKEDGEGAAVLMDQISMIIKRINSVGLTKTLESIDYTAVLDLEHE